MNRIIINENKLYKIISNSIKECLSEEFNNHMLYNDRGVMTTPYDDWERECRRNHYVLSGYAGLGDEEVINILIAYGAIIWDEKSDEWINEDEIVKIFGGEKDICFDFDCVSEDLISDDGLLLRFKNVKDENLRKKLLAAYWSIVDYAYDNAKKC